MRILQVIPMANGAPPAGICELMRALQNSDNAVRSEAEKTLMDAIKGAAVGWISMRFLLGLGSSFEEICLAELGITVVGWVEDLTRRSQRNTVGMDRIPLTGGLDYSDHVVTDFVRHLKPSLERAPFRLRLMRAFVYWLFRLKLSRKMLGFGMR